MSPDVVVHLPSGPVAASRGLRASSYDLGGVTLRRCGVDHDGAELARLPDGRAARVERPEGGAMSAWTVWQIDRAGRPERVGSYPSGADARRVLRAAITRGAVVDPEGEVSEARGIAPRDVAAIEDAAAAWLASATASTMPEPPPATEAPLPVAFEPPVVEPCEDAPHPEIERLRIALADATARAVAAEDRVTELERQLARTDLALAGATARADAAERREAGLTEAMRRLARDLAARDRTIANLRAELAEAHAHPVVRIAAPVRRRALRAPETAVQTLWRRLAEIAEGRR